MFQRHFLIIVLGFLVFGNLPCGPRSSAGESQADTLLIEAESFKQLGGWIVDPQSMQQMGSSYLMAHGYGKPVPDAETPVNISKSGTYTVWVRTRDWTACWKRGTPAGRFQISLGETTLPEILGTNGKDWAWQKAGTVQLAVGKTTLRLHDLTGFNGRCDAIYLTTLANDVPPGGDAQKLDQWRHQKSGIQVEDAKETFDLIVVGGGMSGVCAALAASRTGCRVLLLQDRDVLGGCNSSEIRVGLGGHIHTGLYPKLGNMVKEIAPIHGSGGTYPKEFYEDERKSIIFKKPGCQCRLLTREHVYALEMDKHNPKRIAAVLSRNTHTGKETRFRAPLFTDATGDAVLARMAGCSVMYGREARAAFNEINAPVKADRQVMGHSVLWYAKKREEPVTFPDIDWAIPFKESNVYYIRGGDWEQEAGQYHDMAEETEYIRDYGLLSIYSNWSFIKNHSKRKAEYARDDLDWVSPIGGKRESYRVYGDHVLTQNDLENQTQYPDATAMITWDIDLHYPDPDNVANFGEPFRSCAYHRGFGPPYPVPYRCLYARDCDNLFLAGRHISTTHVAFAAVRVMRTLGMLGEVVGMAASICKQENALPRDVYQKYLEELKNMMAQGVPESPTYHAYGSGYQETYHFKELGFIRIYPNPSPNLSRELAERIRNLGMIHRNEHPKLRKKKEGGKTVFVQGDYSLVSSQPANDTLLLTGGKVRSAVSVIQTDQTVQVGSKGGEINVAEKESVLRLTGFLEDAYDAVKQPGTLIKSGKGTLIDAAIDSFSGRWDVREGTLEIAVERGNGTAYSLGDITVRKNAVFRCTGHNALGIMTPNCPSLVKNIMIDGGTMIGPEKDHVNVGGIILRNGMLDSPGQGMGSSILGNFCLAGKVVAEGKSQITARRISFRSDESQLAGGSGQFETPTADDTLVISSDLHVFHHPSYNGAIIKLGQGKMILTGGMEVPISVRIKEGTLELAGKGHMKSVTVAGSLVVSKPGQKIDGGMTFEKGGTLTIDISAFSKEYKAENLLTVGGTVKGLPPLQFSSVKGITDVRQLDLTRSLFPGRKLTEAEIDQVKGFQLQNR